MELLQLKYFCDAAASENFSKTAKKYGVPASDISQSIRRLEKELNNELFSRSVNKVVLNSKGREFYNRIKDALTTIETAKDRLLMCETEVPINVGICVNRRPVMLAIEKFRENNKDAKIITKHNLGENVGDFDIILSDGSINIPNFSKKKVITERIRLVYKKGLIKNDDIKSLPFITMGEGNSMYKYTLDICAALGFTPNIALQSDDPFYIRKCVELGLGIALVPEFSWRGQFSKGVEFKNIGEFTRDTYIFKKEQKYQPKQVAMLYEMITKEFKKTN